MFLDVGEPVKSEPVAEIKMRKSIMVSRLKSVLLTLKYYLVYRLT